MDMYCVNPQSKVSGTSSRIENSISLKQYQKRWLYDRAELVAVRNRLINLVENRTKGPFGRSATSVSVLLIHPASAMKIHNRYNYIVHAFLFSVVFANIPIRTYIL